MDYLKRSFYSALVFSLTLGIFAIGYGAYTVLAPVNSGDQLTKNMWNQMVNNLSDLDSRVSTLSSSSGSLWTANGSNISYTAGNVGIGAPPGYPMDIQNNGSTGTAIIRATNNNSTKLWTGFRMDREGPTEKWFLGMDSTNDYLRIRSNGSSDVMLFNGSNVGIGTTPGANLTVQNATDGSATVLQLRTSDAAYNNNQELRLDFQQLAGSIARIAMAYFGSDWGLNFYGFSGGLNGSPIMTMRGNGNVGIGTISPSEKLEVNGDVKANDFKGKLNGYKIYGGKSQFPDLSCNTVTSPCTIDISGGGFTTPPSCTLTMGAGDASGYVENMVIQSITNTALKVWKGFYQNEGTTMVIYWTCIGS